MVGLDNSSAAATLVDSSWVPPLLIIHVIYGQSRKEKKKCTAGFTKPLKEILIERARGC